MKFIEKMSDGVWVSGNAHGFDLYTGWIDLKVENLDYDKQVWVDLKIIQSMFGQDTLHQTSLPAKFKESLSDNKERWGCHTPQFPPVMEYPGVLSYIREASYRARLIVNGQEISDLKEYTLYQYSPPQDQNYGNNFSFQSLKQNNYLNHHPI